MKFLRADKYRSFVFVDLTRIITTLDYASYRKQIALIASTCSPTHFQHSLIDIKHFAKQNPYETPGHLRCLVGASRSGCWPFCWAWPTCIWCGTIATGRVAVCHRSKRNSSLALFRRHSGSAEIRFTMRKRLTGAVLIADRRLHFTDKTNTFQSCCDLQKISRQSTIHRHLWDAHSDADASGRQLCESGTYDEFQAFCRQQFRHRSEFIIFTYKLLSL